MEARHMALVLITTLSLIACGNKVEKEAEALLEQANKQYANKQYDQALRTIDSLRKTYPEAIDTRNKALRLYQDVSLKQAQDDLANTDTLLQRTKAEYDSMKVKVDRAKAELKATEAELQALTLKRIERDSLQTRFDMQCAKIKYIHKKQKE